MPSACFQEGSVAISMTPTLPCPFPQICHVYKVLATCKSAVPTFIWTPVHRKMRILHYIFSQHATVCRPCRTKPMQTYLHVNHMALVSPSAHPHRPPGILASHFCTPSQTPRQPLLPLLHTSAKPLNSLLCHPGGEAVEAVSTAATKAAEEAATGSWLKQLESGSLPRITAPGLSQGWFGPWETEEEAPDHDDAAGRSPLVFQLSLLFQAGLAQCNVASAFDCGIIGHAWFFETAKRRSHFRSAYGLAASDRCLPSHAACCGWKGCLDTFNNKLLSTGVGHSHECQQ